LRTSPGLTGAIRTTPPSSKMIGHERTQGGGENDFHRPNLRPVAGPLTPRPIQKRPGAARQSPASTPAHVPGPGHTDKAGEARISFRCAVARGVESGEMGRRGRRTAAFRTSSRRPTLARGFGRQDDAAFAGGRRPSGVVHEIEFAVEMRRDIGRVSYSPFGRLLCHSIRAIRGGEMCRARGQPRQTVPMDADDIGDLG